MFDKKKRKITVRSGFTIIEVVCSVVLLSIIALMTVTAWTSTYTMSFKLKELPEQYYAVQDEVEAELEVLDKTMTEYYRIKNEITNTAAGDPKLVNLNTRKAELEAELNDPKYTKDTVSLFGKNVDIYHFSKTSADGNLTLYAGKPNGVSMDRPVPIFDRVKIGPIAGFSSGDMTALYFSEGDTLSVSTELNEVNKDRYAMTLYQWYTCETGNHVAVDDVDIPQEELYSGDILPSFPHDFTLLPSEKSETLTVDADMLGKFVVCEATPLSSEGAMGRGVVSNMIYLSALPELSGDVGYVLAADPSLERYSYNNSTPVANIKLNVNSISSGDGTGAAASLVKSGGMPKVAMIGTIPVSGMPATRYIEFGNSDRMNLSEDLTEIMEHAAGGLYVCAAVIETEGSSEDFITVTDEGGNEAQTIGFATNERDYTENGSAMHIISASIDASAASLEIGGTKVGIAEIIIAEEDVSGYLTEKYFGN